MKLITRKVLADKASGRWLKTYFRKGEWVYGFDKEVIYCNLKALGDNPTPEDVDRVIGNSSWTSIKCDECGKYVEEVIQVGEEPDYESCTANICKPCLILTMEEFVK